MKKNIYIYFRNTKGKQMVFQNFLGLKLSLLLFTFELRIKLLWMVPCCVLVHVPLTSHISIYISTGASDTIRY